MSKLPAPKVTPTKPFACSSVDYGGPLYVKSGQLCNAKIVKAYITIFVCLATKAVHIELVSDLTTEVHFSTLLSVSLLVEVKSHTYIPTTEQIFKKQLTN